MAFASIISAANPIEKIDRTSLPIKPPYQKPITTHDACIAKTQPAVFSADETANIGKDTETMVTEDYTAESSKFNGKIKKVTIKLK